MKHGSLFSGIGGFDLASEWIGWENVFHCEIESFPRKILHHYWPNAISYEDIKKTDFSIHKGGIDIITGGFPCQPYSMAGKRKGKEDERHLWPEMLRAIREIQPRWVVGENVFGLINWNGGLVFDEVQSDLEAEGYEVQAYVLPAAAINAPHRRDRVWFVAYSNKCTTRPSRTSGKVKINGIKNNDEQSIRGKQTEQHNRCSDVLRNAPNTNDNGQNECDSQYEINTSQGGKYAQCNIKSRNGNGDVADTSNKGLQRRQNKGENRRTQSNGIDNRRGDFAGVFCTDWSQFPTQSPICGGNDGIPDRLDDITFPKWRNESIKGYGNAIVPQVVFQIFKAIEEYESRC